MRYLLRHPNRDVEEAVRYASLRGKRYLGLGERSELEIQV